MTATAAGTLNLRYAQGEVFSSRKRFRVLVAGRRFGKSYLSCIELLRGAIERPGETFFYAAPTYRMAKDIAWKVMKKLVPKAWIKSKNETDLKIELVNGSTIELKGTENAMALRGRSLAGVVLDEAAFMSSEVWFEVIRPALADKQGWALFISTPDGTASWFYDLWCYCEQGDPDWQPLAIHHNRRRQRPTRRNRSCPRPTRRPHLPPRIRSLVREPIRPSRRDLLRTTTSTKRSKTFPSCPS